MLQAIPERITNSTKSLMNNTLRSKFSSSSKSAVWLEKWSKDSMRQSLPTDKQAQARHTQWKATSTKRKKERKGLAKCRCPRSMMLAWQSELLEKSLRRLRERDARRPSTFTALSFRSTTRKSSICSMLKHLKEGTRFSKRASSYAGAKRSSSQSKIFSFSGATMPIMLLKCTIKVSRTRS